MNDNAMILTNLKLYLDISEFYTNPGEVCSWCHGEEADGRSLGISQVESWGGESVWNHLWATSATLFWTLFIHWKQLWSGFGSRPWGSSWPPSRAPHPFNRTPAWFSERSSCSDWFPRGSSCSAEQKGWPHMGGLCLGPLQCEGSQWVCCSPRYEWCLQSPCWWLWVWTLSLTHHHWMVWVPRSPVGHPAGWGY